MADVPAFPGTPGFYCSSRLIDCRYITVSEMMRIHFHWIAADAFQSAHRG
jgi:hypothetical protein